MARVLPALTALLLVLTAAGPAASQVSEDWKARFDGPAGAQDQRPLLALDESGNAYIAGTSTGIDSGYDFSTIKYDSLGRQLWERRFNGDANSLDMPQDIAVDPQGNVIVTGYSWRNFHTDGGTEADFATLKYDPDGNLLWQRFYDGMGRSDYVERVAVDGAGNVYLMGPSTGEAGLLFEYAVVKYDADGRDLWVRRFTQGPDGALPIDMAVAADGTVHVTGIAAADGGDSREIATLKYGPDGERLWAASFSASLPGQDKDTATSLAVDGEGNAYVAGWAWVTEKGRRDFLVLKYGPDGNLLWRKGWGGRGDDLAYDVAVDSAGNVYISGVSVHPRGRGSDATVARLDRDGALLWERVFRASPGYLDGEPRMVLGETAGAVYIALQARSAGDVDFTVLKVRLNGALSWVYRQRGQRDDRVHDMAIDPQGALVLTGQTLSAPRQTTDFLTVKIHGAAGRR
jgi:uncharacterized delta-60 repeat protein